MAEFGMTETHIVVSAEGVAGPPGPKGDKGDKGNTGDQGIPGIVMVNHGSDATVARPDVTIVYWVGSVLPNNATATDLWYQP